MIDHRSNPRWRAHAALPAAGLLALASGCLPQHLYQTSAPPIEKAVALIESDPAVAAALGDDAEVSLAVSRLFERDVSMKWRTGQDRVRLLTTVRGSRGEAQLDLDAVNVNEQGWAGSFRVDRPGQQVLRDGAYVTEGATTLLAGTFAADGTPQVTPAAP